MVGTWSRWLEPQGIRGPTSSCRARRSACWMRSFRSYRPDRPYTQVQGSKNRDHSVPASLSRQAEPPGHNTLAVPTTVSRHNEVWVLSGRWRYRLVIGGAISELVVFAGRF
jgi:hypothetical protein